MGGGRVRTESTRKNDSSRLLNQPTPTVRPTFDPNPERTSMTVLVS